MNSISKLELEWFLGTFWSQKNIKKKICQTPTLASTTF